MSYKKTDQVMVGPGGPLSPEWQVILTPEAVAFVEELARRFTPEIVQLLAGRERRQAEFDAGALPDFLADTRKVRESDWRVAPIPADLLDRRVEITGPTERKMVINALNSGARVFMADFEDSLCPSWANVIDGQVNLRDAVRRTIEFSSPEGKVYRLRDQTAVLLVRPRGWHLEEKHWLCDGRPVPGALVDFGLYLFHNAAELKSRGTGPYFYLPKLESHRRPALGAGVRPRRAAARHCRTARSGDRADRDHCRRLRDGRDPRSSCATTSPGSTAGAGTTSSASSRNSARARSSCCRTATR